MSSSSGPEPTSRSFNPLPRSWRRVRTRKNDPKITLPNVPDGEHIDQANSRQVVPPLDSDGNAVRGHVAPSRHDVAAAERYKHSQRVAGMIDKHDGRFLRAHDEDNAVMRLYGDPDHNPHYLSEQTRAMEDSRWSLMRPRLDHYARAAFPRLSMTDANFDEQYRTTEARLDRLEQYVGETDCEVLRVKLDHDIDELDERLRVVRPESLDFQQQLRQLNKEYELDKLLLVRHFFLHHISPQHGHRSTTANSHSLMLTEEKVRRAYRDAVQDTEDAGHTPHLLPPSQARYWSVYMVHIIERRYRSLGPEEEQAELLRGRRVVTHKVVSRMQANPPKDAAEAHEDLEKAYADVHAMTPEALKHAYFMLSGGRNRPASVAESTHTDTASERSISPPPTEHEHHNELVPEPDDAISPLTRLVGHDSGAGYFRHHHAHNGSERRPPTPYPPPQPTDGSISPISSISSDGGGVPLDHTPSPSSPSPPRRVPTPHDPLAAHLAQAHHRPSVETPTSRWFHGASGEGPSDWKERNARDVVERRRTAPRNVPTHAALRRKSVSGHYIPDDDVPERSSSLPQRKPGQLKINFT
ncbi:hypothetical protein JCM8208_005573 [Rhodotorula glutinis]